jgi:hypothetical protein
MKTPRENLLWALGKGGETTRGEAKFFYGVSDLDLDGMLASGELKNGAGCRCRLAKARLGYAECGCRNCHDREAVCDSVMLA